MPAKNRVNNSDLRAKNTGRATYNGFNGWFKLPKELINATGHDRIYVCTLAIGSLFEVPGLVHYKPKRLDFVASTKKPRHQNFLRLRYRRNRDDVTATGLANAGYYSEGAVGDVLKVLYNRGYRYVWLEI